MHSIRIKLLIKSKCKILLRKERSGRTQASIIRWTKIWGATRKYGNSRPSQDMATCKCYTRGSAVSIKRRSSRIWFKVNRATLTLLTTCISIAWTTSLRRILIRTEMAFSPVQARDIKSPSLLKQNSHTASLLQLLHRLILRKMRF